MPRELGGRSTVQEGEEVMGSDAPKTDWERIERRIETALEECFGGPESGVVRDVMFLLETGVLAEAYGWPEILHFETEYPVPRGRIDILLFHVDGSATVIECKPGKSARDVLPAVGQVMSYGLQLGYSRVFSKIRLAIASRARAVDLAGIRPVLRQCGVEPMFCGLFKEASAMLAAEYAASERSCH